MARMTFKAGEEYALKLEAVGARSEEMAIKAIETGAGIVTNEIRKNLTANLNDPESASRNGRVLFKNFYNKTSGSLFESLGITPVKRDKDGIVTGYTGGVKMMGKAVSADFAPSTPDDNPLYANNGVAENDSSGASGGTLKTVLDRLTMEAAADLFGLEVTEVEVKVGEDTVKGKSLDYTGMEQSAPVGVAYIRMNQEDGIRSHEVVYYRRAVYSMPNEKAAQSPVQALRGSTTAGPRRD